LNIKLKQTETLKHKANLATVARRGSLKRNRSVFLNKQTEIMKAVFKKVNECVSYYNRSTKGFEFVGKVNNDKEMYNLVASLEDNDFFPQENGIVLDASGSEVFDPSYPDDFDFGDYSYVTYDMDSLDEFDYAHLFRATEKQN
jgi:hypothetical protein